MRTVPLAIAVGQLHRRPVRNETAYTPTATVGRRPWLGETLS